MTTISIPASVPYRMQIGHGILNTLGQQLHALGGIRTVCLVSDTTVWSHFGEGVQRTLTGAGFTVCPFVFPAGEQSKNGEVFLALLNHMAQTGMTRSDAVAALGGGVVGDMAGFCAACYMRGIRFVQIPTTLLSAVDSSVGGKTAIDLPAGKNLAGAFHQPSFVLCDLDFLDTLPPEIFADGCAEVIKTAILFDPRMFEELQRWGPAFPREKIIARCVAHKRDVVCQDEQEHGLRQLLNLGHTIGHGVEASSGFTLSHGSSVAIGTAIVARAAAEYGICSRETSSRIQTLLERFSLPTRTSFSPSALRDAALSDKKRSGDTVSLILPRQIGDCFIRPTHIREIESFIQAGL